MIAYWKQEMNKVLMYQPDLIVMTEICDHPSGLNSQEQTEYYKIRKNQVRDFFASVAKENRCYIAYGTKREENGIWYNSCVVLDREGKVAGIYDKNYPTVYEMPDIKPGTETHIIQFDFGCVGCVICFDLNFNELRERYAAMKPDLLLFKQKYGDKVIISDPGRVGSVLITSEHDQVSAADMVKEFNIELFDDYLDRSRQKRRQLINN